MNSNTLLTIRWCFLIILTTLILVQSLGAQCNHSCNFPFDKNDIIFPFDITTTECGVSTLSPEYLNPPYDKPTFNIDDCDKITFNYVDTYSPTEGPACFKILRKWTVIDWCQYNKEKVSGKWTHTQTIKVIDYSPPVFKDGSDDLIIENLSLDSENSYVEIIREAEDCSPDLKYSFKIDLFHNGVIDHTGNSFNASGNYPIGNHKISFSVEDGCGNKGFCSFFFKIKKTNTPATSLSTKSKSYSNNTKMHDKNHDTNIIDKLQKN